MDIQYKDLPKVNLEIMWGQRWSFNTVDIKPRHGFLLPKGTIKHLIGKDMTYSDEPIKIL